MNHCPVPTCLRTIEGKILEANPAFKHTFKIPGSQIAEINLFDLFDEVTVRSLNRNPANVGTTLQITSAVLKTEENSGVYNYTEVYLKPDEIECYFYESEYGCSAHKDVQKKHKYLHGLNEISQILIENKEYKQQMNRCLKLMGELSEANRVYIFENYFDTETGTTFTCQIFEWTSEPGLAQIDNPDLRTFPLELITPETFKGFLRNHHYCATKSEFIPEIKEVLESQGITSILFLPMFVNEKLWGFIGFDHCYYERKWDDDDLTLLKQVALNISLYITRNQLEEANLRYKDRLNSALNAGKIGVWDWNLNDNTVFYSPMVYSMLGYSEEEFGSGFSAWESRVHPEDLSSVKDLINKYLDGATPEYISEHRLRTKDGSYKWILDKGRITEFDEYGKVRRMVGTHTDITELRTLQHKVINSLQSFHSLFSVNPLPIFIINPDTMEVLTANSSAKEKYGDNFSGRSKGQLHQILADDEKITFYEALLKNDSGFSKTVWRHRDVSGKTFFATCTVHQIFYEGRDALILAISDVTAKITSEIQLLASEERLAAIITAMPDMLFVLSKEGVYEEYYSPELNNSNLAAPKEFFIGKKVMDILPSHLADKFYTEFEKTKSGGRMGILNYELDLPIGKQYFEARLTSITSKNKVLCIVRNMTEKYAAEKKIIESEEKLRIVARNIPHGTVNLFDGNLQLLYSEGDPALTFSQNCVGCTAMQRCENCEYSAEKNYFLRAMRGEEVRFETEINEKKYLTYINPIRDSFDNIKYVIQMSTEITEYRNQQDELFATRQRLEGLVKAMLDGVYMYDMKSRKLLFVNEVIVTICGVSLQELHQSPVLWLKRIHPEDRSVYLEVLRNVRVKLRSTCEYRILNADNKYIWVIERTWCVTDEMGVPQRIEGLITDISARKKSEQEVKEALEKERELSLLKSKFISNTSHEFRTPLAVIQSSVNILENYAARLSDDQKSFQYNRINESIGNLTQMLEEVLYLEKANANKLKFDSQQVDVHQLCIRIITDVHTEKNSTIEITIEDHLINPVHELDQRLFYTIVSNLLKNAVKYSPEGKLISVILTEDDNSLQVEIKDQGIGIPSNELNLLFEPFFRASNAEEYTGTGLGLPIVKKAVELHNGSISIKSKIGIGSSFMVQLPLPVLQGA